MGSNSKKFVVNLNKYKILLLVAGALLIGILVLVVLGIKETKRQASLEPKDIKAVLQESKISSEHVKITAKNIEELPIKEGENKYYIVTDVENHKFFVLMDEEGYNSRKTELDNKKETEVTGIVQKISIELETVLIGYYNQLIGEDYLNFENFNQYFSPVYVNTKLTIEQVNLDFNLARGLAMAFFLVMALYFVNKRKVDKSINRFTKSQLREIYEQIDSKDSIEFNKGEIYLAKDYIADAYSGLKIIRYDDIIWVYPKKKATLTFGSIKTVVVMLKNKQAYYIGEITSRGKKGRDLQEKLYFEISKRSKNALRGYTKENIKKIMEA